MRASKLYPTEAVILRRKNLGEADRILTIFTKEHGKMRVIAKGVRRITSRRAPSLEPFSHVLLYLYKGKVWDHVTDVKVIHAFSTLGQNIDFISRGYYVCELIDSLLPEKQEHQDIFDLLISTLTHVSLGMEWESSLFARDLLVRLGYLSESHVIPNQSMQSYIENITQRRLHSFRFIARLKD